MSLQKSIYASKFCGNHNTKKLQKNIIYIEHIFYIINVFTVFKKFLADSQMFELQVYVQCTYNGCRPWCAQLSINVGVTL